MLNNVYMTLDEIIYDVQNYLTISGSLPKILPDKEIERLLENEVSTWFYENYDDATIKEYLYIPKESFGVDQNTKYKYVELPCNVQYVTWLYQVTDRNRLFDLGVSAPNLAVNIGATQPYVSPSLSTIGDLSIYKVVIDGFADMLDQLSKHTLKFDFNKASKALHILTSMNKYTLYQDALASLVAEVYSKIPTEDIYELDHFRRYIRYASGMQLGRILKMYNYNLPGGVTLNADAIYSDNETQLTTLKDEIKAQNPNSGWFWMVKR